MLNKANIFSSFSNVVWESQHDHQSYSSKVSGCFFKKLWLMSLTEWWNWDETMGLLEPQAVLSWHGWVEGDGPSSSKKCLLDKLRCKQPSSDHQDGMRGIECHQHSIDMKTWRAEDDEHLRYITQPCFPDDLGVVRPEFQASRVDGEGFQVSYSLDWRQCLQQGGFHRECSEAQGLQWFKRGPLQGP